MFSCPVSWFWFWFVCLFKPITHLQLYKVFVAGDPQPIPWRDPRLHLLHKPRQLLCHSWEKAFLLQANSRPALLPLSTSPPLLILLWVSLRLAHTQFQGFAWLPFCLSVQWTLNASSFPEVESPKIQIRVKNPPESLVPRKPMDLPKAWVDLGQAWVMTSRLPAKKQQEGGDQR